MCRPAGRRPCGSPANLLISGEFLSGRPVSTQETDGRFAIQAAASTEHGTTTTAAAPKTIDAHVSALEAQLGSVKKSLR